jgi:hypothetical protein
MAYDPNNPNGQATMANSQPVVIASNQSAVKVDGSAVTQPVSASSLPLPTGAATAAKQPALGTAGTASADVLSVQGVASMTALKVDGSAVTQPMSAASLPLPTGAATAAKQPALGTAGSASADVITVQGVASMTALKVDGSGVTQPVSGTVTANAGTNLNTSALALETGGNLATIATRTPALGQALAAASVPVILPSATITTLTPPAAITGFALDATLTGGTQQTKITDGTNVASVKAASTAAAATDKAVVVAVSPNNSVAVTGTFWQSTQPVSLATNTPTIAAGTNLMGKVGIDQTTVGTTNGVTPVPAASGGPTLARVKAAASTNATSLKGSAGQLYGYALFNNTASAKFVKIYNKASAPTVGTDTPAFTIIVPASGGANVEWSMGIPLGTGVAYAITGAVADSDTTSTAADDVHGLILYK